MIQKQDDKSDQGFFEERGDTWALDMPGDNSSPKVETTVERG